jgi:MSHA pilin protein MshC
MRKSGFTLAELVTVLAIAAIVAVFAAPKLVGTFASTRGFYDRLISQLTYARKAAIAQRRQICAQITSAQSSLVYGGASCSATGVVGPTGSAFTLSVPSGIAVTNATFQFDALGRYLDSGGVLATSNLSITVSGDGSYTITVERDTGYVH